MVIDAKALGWRTASLRVGQFLWTLLPGFVLAYLIMGLLWPWGVLAPLNPFRALEYFDKFFERPWQELYEGQLISVPDMPASYLPHLFVLKLPELMLALGFLGSVGALIALTRRANLPGRRAGLLTLLLAVYLPIAIATVTRPALYNGVRHFLFVVPPFAVLGGLAAGWLVEQLRPYGRPALTALAAVFIASLALPVVGMARLHPYEYTYFNPSAGGVRSAEDRYMLDYWGLAFKQAAEALREWLAANNLQAPNGRHWVVAICGPQAAAKVELGPQFETTFDQKQADFALALGTFYCRHLQAPIIADIVRDGVSYARAYDLRGRAKQELLTVPPP
jgi:hypothetical protein